MNRILCSSGAFMGKVNNNDIRLLKKYAPLLHCDGFELMMSNSWYPDLDDTIAEIKSYGLCIPAVHAQKSLGESLCGMTASYEDNKCQEYVMSKTEDEQTFKEGTERFLKNLKLANGVGAEKMVLHLWNGQVSDKNIEKNVERFGIWKDMADKAGIELLVENVICNTKDPLYNVALVAKAYKDAGFTYDTKMAAFHGQTMKLFDKEYEWIVKEGRIKHLHLNDYGGGYMDWGHMRVLPIGSGNIDFDEFFDKFFEYGYTGDYTVEATAFSGTGEIDVEMLNTCFDRIRKYIIR